MKPVHGLAPAPPRRHRPKSYWKLNGEFNAILADQAMKARIESLGASVFAGSPVAFCAAFIADEKQKWAAVVKQAGIRPD